MRFAERVIVVGAGPVGLVAASALAGEGIPVTIVEAERDIARDLRASTFHPPTLDMLERFGVVPSLIQQGLICPYWQFRDRKEGVVATFDLSHLRGETGHPYRLQCEQWRLSLLLREHLEKTGTADFIYDARAVDLRQDEASVTLIVERPDGTREELAGRYLVGADGARSAIRKALAIDFPGVTIPEIFLSLSTTFRFDEAIPDLANIAYLSDPEEWLVLLRTKSLWRVLFPTDPTMTEAQIVSDAVVEKRLQSVVAKPDPYEVVHRTAYRVHERVAAHYVKGRVFLAGDAAHLNNPLGGMGMNGGIHDAINLAEKLAKVWRGEPIETMGRYERQRRKVALDVVQQQALRNRAILNSKDVKVRQEFYDDLRRTVADPARHRAYVLRSSLIQSLRDVEKIA